MAAIVVFSMFPTADEAAAAARALVGEQLAACVNLVPGVRSIYRWKGELCDDTETLAMIKTSEERVAAVQARIVALHSYEVPEVIALPIIGGHPPYLAWVAEQTRE